MLFSCLSAHRVIDVVKGFKFPRTFKFILFFLEAKVMGRKHLFLSTEPEVGCLLINNDDFQTNYAVFIGKTVQTRATK